MTTIFKGEIKLMQILSHPVSNDEALGFFLKRLLNENNKMSSNMRSVPDLTVLDIQFFGGHDVYCHQYFIVI